QFFAEALTQNENSRTRSRGIGARAPIAPRKSGASRGDSLSHGALARRCPGSAADETTLTLVSSTWLAIGQGVDPRRARGGAEALRLEGGLGAAGGGARVFDELRLAPARGLSFFDRDAAITPVGLELPGLLVVGEHQLEDFVTDAMLELWVEDRKDSLDPAPEV